MKPNWGKCTKQPLRWAHKGNGIRKNNDSSKSPTLSFLHSWAKTKKHNEAKEGQHRQNKERERERWKRHDTNK